MPDPQPAATPRQHKPYIVQAPGVRAVSDEELYTLHLFGCIDDWGWALDDLRWELRSVDDETPVRLVVTSVGGNAFHALSMYDMLKARAGEVVVEIQGMALSAAAFVSMAGDRRMMSENAFLMVHEASGSEVYGRSEDLRRTADLIDKVNSRQVALFVEATGQDEATVRGWLAAETYFTAEEALAVGLITEVLPATKLAAAAQPLIHASALPARAPAGLRQLLATTEESTPMPEPKPKAGGTTPNAGDGDPGTTPSPEAIAAAVRDALPTALGEILPDLVAEAVMPAIRTALTAGPIGSDAEPSDPKPEPAAVPPAVQAQLDALIAANKAREERDAARDADVKATKIKATLDQAVLERRLPPALRATFEAAMQAAPTAEALDALVTKVQALAVTVPAGNSAFRAALADADGADTGLDVYALAGRFDPNVDLSQANPADLRVLAAADKAASEAPGDDVAKAAARRRAIFAAAGEPLTGTYGSN